LKYRGKHELRSVLSIYLIYMPRDGTLDGIVIESKDEHEYIEGEEVVLKH